MSSRPVDARRKSPKRHQPSCSAIVWAAASRALSSDGCWEPNAVKQYPHRRKTALEFADRIAVEGRIREDTKLTVHGVGDSASLGLFGDQFGEVLAEIVEHRGDESVLAAEMPMNQSVVDP